MYSDMSFEFVLGRMLSGVPDDVDKREGSVIYDALAPAALELAMFYAALDNVIDETFADTAGREMLIRRAAERGLIPYAATFAIVRGEFDVDVPLGARFSVVFGGAVGASEDLRYRVTEKISGGGYRLVCESVGTVGNRASGDLRPVDYIEGLTEARIAGVLIPGEDEEDTEHLRGRYFESIDSRYYGGNVADYRRIILSMQGVGGVKVFPVYYGAGTVRLVVQDYDWGVPTRAMLDQIKNAVDPSYATGTGAGAAPIGHVVVVEGIRGVAVDVSAEFTMRTGFTFDDVTAELDGVLEGYVRELAVKWQSSDALAVNASQIESRFLDAAGGKILSITNLKINNKTERSITLTSVQIPIRGVITNVK